MVNYTVKVLAVGAGLLGLRQFYGNWGTTKGR